MEKCPACGAPYKGKRQCHRCKLDLNILLNIEATANYHLEKVFSALSENDIENLYIHAKRCVALRRSPQIIKLAACAAMMNRKFYDAVMFWKIYKRSIQTSEI